MTDFLIIGNGDCNLDKVKQLTINKVIIALDGAANNLFRINIKPNYILGDLDSISDDVLQSFYNMDVKIMQFIDQNYTDLEKAIQFCDKLDLKSITLTGVLGKERTDHTLAAFSVLKKYYDIARKLSILSNDIVEYISNKKIKHHGFRGQKLSIVGFPQATVTSSGLKWELDNTICALGYNNSFCNEFAKEVITLEITGEALVISSNTSC